MNISSFEALKCSIKAAEERYGKVALEYRIEAFNEVCACIDFAVNDDSCTEFGVDVREDGCAVMTISTKSFLKNNVDAAEEILLSSKDLHFGKNKNEDGIVVTIVLESVWDN